MQRPRWAPRAALVWIALGVALGASNPYLSRLMNANERPRLLQAIALVDYHTWKLNPVLLHGIDPGIDIARREGAVYPNKPPGATIIAVVAYYLLKLWNGLGGAVPSLGSLTLAARLLGAWLPTIGLAYVARARLGGDRDPAVHAAIMLIVLATPTASYAHVLFGHSLTALCILVGLMWLVDAVRAAPGGADQALARAWAGGFATALAVTFEYAAVFVAIPLLWWFVRTWRRGTWRYLAMASFGAVVPIGALAAYHTTVFGAPWATGYHHVVDVGFAEIHAQGLLGLTWPRLDGVIEDLVSPWGGLLTWAPVCVLAPVGWWRRPMVRDSGLKTPYAGVFLMLLLVTLCLVQSGGWRVGPRYMVAAFPCAIPGVAVALDSLRRRASAITAIWAISLTSVFANALAANLFPHLIPQGHPLSDLLLPLLVDGYQPYTLLDGWRGEVPGSVWLPMGLALALVTHALWELTPKEVRVRTAGLGLAGAIALLALLWLRPQTEVGLRNYAAVRSIWEPPSAKARRVELSGAAR